MRHFQSALDNVRPTIDDDIREYFEQMEDQFRGSGPERDRRRGSGRIGFQ
jgi:transitional endoplasmic reticulum ATPase